ncbi:hypothetical protein NDU88_001834 [Pleurodeles waltl]|uniref:Uncharacterized protein n=1 Tax=Pleurodeles waltl TaxID=8319 RepID=A0AAV7RDY6_PLEWA|nr:hypothetical protein NDU88_001834 [Pleurodeles waltl]
MVDNVNAMEKSNETSSGNVEQEVELEDDVSDGNVGQEEMEECEEMVERESGAIGVKRKILLPGWLKDYVV